MVNKGNLDLSSTNISKQGCLRNTVNFEYL